MHRQSNATPTIGAALVLIIGMGFGRFAFTGLYPLMISDHVISVQGGSYAASANYAGYLIGAIMSAFLPGVPSRQICNVAVLSTVALLGVLALPLPEWGIITVRGLAGVSSAFAMVAASHWLIHDRQHHHGAPTLYAGVGIGILVSAEMIALGHLASFPSTTIWLLLASGAGVLAVVAIVMQRRADKVPVRAEAVAAGPESSGARPLGPAMLIAIYGLAGFGYIITATYLPLLVGQVLKSTDPVHIWAVFGLGAVPSCFFWHAMHQRFGTRVSLAANLIVQAVGVVLPLLHTPVAYILSALLVGGTFMGTATIALPAGRKAAAAVKFNRLAVMTTFYGIGQIVGPLVADMVYSRSQSFDVSLAIAGAALLGGAVLSLAGRVQEAG
ncbi:YbfB/YjiJ family MFS transporter [Bosea sp. RCC_152_1]|uniref:YbfB/YjiJ family MFS transporter n=1 Tax=Bosea sp. RCC_152_1 TaxID=3239228 RepID=UPI003525B3D7